MASFSQVVQQILLNFPVFVEGILLFQLVYMFVQYALTKRVEFLWYVGYILTALIICFSVGTGDNFFTAFLESRTYAISLLSLSSLCYWIFWKHLFSINATDGAVYKLVRWMIFLFLLHVTLDIIAKVIPGFQPTNYFIFGILSNIPQLTSLWLFFFTIRTRDKTLAGLLVFGAVAGNILTLISLMGFFKGLVGLPPDNDGLFWFTLSYLVETLFFSLGLAYRTQQIFQRNKDLELRIAETKMAALRAQMNPHFIHNCLNAINRFILNQENDAATHYLTKFSRLIREVLNHSREEQIPLADELKTIERYLEMESLRFSDQFKYEIQVDKKVVPEQTNIPPMLIQPFVENAIYHGLLPKKGERKVTIAVSREQEQLKIIVTDNGVGRIEAARLQSMDILKQKSFGAQITSERVATLREFTGIQAGIETIDLYDIQGASTGTQVVLRLPLYSTDGQVLNIL